jgi:hypothetical protein
MKYGNIELTGSLDISGSFTVPSGITLPDETSTPNGSLFFDTANSVLCGLVSGSWNTMPTVAGSNPYAVPISYLLVAGGGGAGGGSVVGGYTGGGGGGAGGLLSSSLSSAASGSTFTVTVGSGGSGGSFTSSATNNKGTGGVNSTIAGTGITTLTAIGGGAGSAGGANGTGFGIGEDGGSGGGSGYRSTTAGSGTNLQGNDGGHAGTGEQGSGGGGGATEAGQDGFTGGDANYYGGNGGSGSLSSITGTSTFYAGGGAAGGLTLSGYSNNSPGAGGPGGGGDGGGNAGLSGTAGTVNTGGGGGGGSRDESTNNGGDGGSGVAIFAYDSGSFNCAGGIVGDAGNGRKYNQFNSSGTFKVGSTSDFGIVTGNNLQLHLDAGNFASRGTSTWTDLSGNGNNGTVSGATLTGTHYTFDGSNDYVSLAEASGASTSPHTVYGTFTGASETNWTLECWFKTSENDTDTWGTPIIGRDSNDLFGQLTVKDNKVHYMHANPSWLYVTSTSNVTDDNWHHVVLVNYSNATMDLWLDGVKEATGVNSTVYYSVNTRYFKISHVARGYTGDYTACEVAQIRLYDTNLSDAEVLQNYNATKTNFI